MAGNSYPSTGGTFGSFTVKGGSTFKISPAATGTYAGVAIFEERDDTNALTFSGTATANLQGGLLYAVKAKLSIETGASLKHAPIIVNRLKMSGQSALTDLAGSSALDSTAGATNLLTNQQLAMSLGTSSSIPSPTALQLAPPVNSSVATATTSAEPVSAIGSGLSGTLASSGSNVLSSLPDDGFILNLDLLAAVGPAQLSLKHRG
jgi:hypothetical protein